MFNCSPENGATLEELSCNLDIAQDVVSHDEAAEEDQMAEDAHSIVYAAWLFPPDRDKRKPRCLMYEPLIDVEDGDEQTSRPTIHHFF